MLALLVMFTHSKALLNKLPSLQTVLDIQGRGKWDNRGKMRTEERMGLGKTREEGHERNNGRRNKMNNGRGNRRNNGRRNKMNNGRGNRRNNGRRNKMNNGRGNKRNNGKGNKRNNGKGNKRNNGKGNKRNNGKGNKRNNGKGNKRNNGVPLTSACSTCQREKV